MNFMSLIELRCNCCKYYISKVTHASNISSQQSVTSVNTPVNSPANTPIYILANTPVNTLFNTAVNPF